MQRKVFVVLAVGAVSWYPSAAPADDRGARADAAVQVTAMAAPARAYAAPELAVHPTDPSIIALAEGEARGSTCGLQVSTDAGLSWSEAAAPAVDGAPRCVWSNNGRIVDIEFAPDGTLYYAFSAGAIGDYTRKIFVAKSSDLGRTYQIVEIPGQEPDLDAGDSGINAVPSLVLDPENPRRMYVAWWNNYGVWNLEDVLPKDSYLSGRVMVATSTDGGGSFSPPVRVGDKLEGSFQAPKAVVVPGGDLLVFFGEITWPSGDGGAPGAHLYLATSKDRGNSFVHETLHQMPDGEDHSILGSPMGAVGPTGDVYVTWEDMGDGPARVLFMRSSDGGATWSTPVRINDVSPARKWTWNELWPSIGVAASGRIDVAWFEWRNDPTRDPKRNTFQDLYHAYSHDGGRTWSTNMRVTDRSIDRSIGIRDTGMASPPALASLDDVVYAAWDDTRNGDVGDGAQDVYFTRVQFGAERGITALDEAESGWWIPGLIGLAAGLAVGGAALMIGTRVARRPHAGAPERVPERR